MFMIIGTFALSQCFLLLFFFLSPFYFLPLMSFLIIINPEPVVSPEQSYWSCNLLYLPCKQFLVLKGECFYGVSEKGQDIFSGNKSSTKMAKRNEIYFDSESSWLELTNKLLCPTGCDEMLLASCTRLWLEIPPYLNGICWINFNYQAFLKQLSPHDCTGNTVAMAGF